MGTTSSKRGNASTPNKPKTKLQILGDKYPFGDDELETLIRCHNRIRQQTTNTHRQQQHSASLVKTSFLTKMALGCYSSSQEEEDDETDTIKTKIKRLEDTILPDGFGQRLEMECFSLDCDFSDSADDVVSEDDGVEVEVEVDTSKSPSNMDCCGKILPSSFTNSAKKNVTKVLTKKKDDLLNDMRLDKFVAGVSDCGRRGSRVALLTLLKCCCCGDDYKISDAEQIMDLGYRLAIGAAFLVSEEEKVEEYDENKFVPKGKPDALIRSLVQYSEEQQKRKSERNLFQAASMDSDRDIFIRWTEKNIPLLSASLSTFLHHLLFPKKAYPPSRTPFVFPHLDGQESAFFKNDCNVSLFSLACITPALGGRWHRLYTSTHDGLSFNRLLLSLLGYSGPTLLIISSACGGTFGAFSSSPWKESKDFYGNADTFLYRLHPSFGVYHTRNKNQNYQYCNSAARSKGYDQLAHGIGFGGSSATQPRLFLAETFEGCVASNRDLTFEAGALLPGGGCGDSSSTDEKEFEIESLEVWGVGGDEVVAEALGARSRQREIAEANIRKARKVDKAQFLDDFKSGLIESKAFKHREQMKGRVDCHVEDME